MPYCNQSSAQSRDSPGRQAADDVEIELDRVYSTIGRIDPARCRNREEVLGAGLRRFGHLFGGAAEANAFLDDWLGYLDRDDTSSFSTYWVVKGLVPQMGPA